MAIKIISTRDFGVNGVKVMVSGPAGIGKTKLCATAPAPLIISAEAGLLSLSDVDIPVIEVKTVDDVMDAYQFVTESKEAEQFETICLDSVSEIAEVLLSTYKKEFKDPRAAYGTLNDDMSALIRSFRDLKGKHVYFSAKETKIVDDSSGLVSYKGSMPGKTMLNSLPFFFDEVLSMGLGKLEDGTYYRYLQTFKDLQRVDNKDRSGKLGLIEKPDLAYIFNKISGKEDEKVEESTEKEIEEVVEKTTEEPNQTQPNQTKEN